MADVVNSPLGHADVRRSEPDSWQSPRDDLAGAQDLARQLDRDHPPSPGALPSIGTCRTCGLLIGRGQLGVWHHRPSVGEIGAAQSWLVDHAADAHGVSSSPDDSRSAPGSDRPLTIKEPS